MGRFLSATLAACVVLAAGIGGQPQASAQNLYNNQFQSYQLNRFYYWPYYYFPHNYWPLTTPKWPEPPGAPYMPPPAYQAYPAYLDPYWHYPMWHAMKYYRGSHFWLDQF